MREHPLGLSAIGRFLPTFFNNRYMKRLVLFILAIIQISFLQGQAKKRFSLEVNYGVGGNFFVQSYDETPPIPVKAFYNKNFIGSVGGFRSKIQYYH